MDKHISFRSLKLEDFEIVLNWSKDEQFCEANGWSKNRDEDALFKWWKNCVNMKREDFVRYGIVCNNRLIGYIDLTTIQHNSAEIGIAIGDSELWGHGIGTKAMNMLIEDELKNRNVTTFYGETHESNVRSRKMLEKLGFVEINRVGNDMYLGHEVQLIQYKLMKQQ